MSVLFTDVNSQGVPGLEDLAAVAAGVHHQVVLEVLRLNVAEHLVAAGRRELALHTHEPLERVLRYVFRDFSLASFDQIYKKDHQHSARTNT